MTFQSKDQIITRGSGDIIPILSSKNRIRKTKTNSLSVGQATATLVEAKVKAKAKTGKNRASWNTGGSTSIDTGSANSSADLAVHGGSNIVNGCGCNGEILPVE